MNNKGQEIDSCSNIDLTGIETQGFLYQDIDTILIEKFEKGSNFKEGIASFYVYPKDVYKDTNIYIGSINGDTTREVEFDFNTYYDWNIKFPNDLNYKIYAMKVAFHFHNTMFEKISYCEMDSYVINGDTIHDKQVVIRKVRHKNDFAQ